MGEAADAVEAAQHARDILDAEAAAPGCQRVVVYWGWCERDTLYTSLPARGFSVLTVLEAAAA